jgi:hypothetical protein
MISRVTTVLLALGAMASVGAPAQSRDLSPGAAAAVGVLGGLALGGAIAGGAAQGGYYPGRPVAGPRAVYGPPPEPVYLEREAPVECYVRRRRYENEYGDVTVRRERICE